MTKKKNLFKEYPLSRIKDKQNSFNYIMYHVVMFVKKIFYNISNYKVGRNLLINRFKILNNKIGLMPLMKHLKSGITKKE